MRPLRLGKSFIFGLLQWAVAHAVWVEAAPLEITTTALPFGQELTAYSETLTATGGTAPYTWSALSSCVAWGRNTNGQLNVPSGLSALGAVSGGGSHSLALKADGTVAAWGSNTSGQCNVPTGLSGVTAISAGYLHSVALKGDGTVAAWGSNPNGECNVPTGLSGVTAISAGSNHSLALKNDGTVVAWGYNGDGRSSVPSGLTNVTAVAGGGRHSLALKADGTVVAWGNNSYSECTVPAGLSGVVGLSAGIQHSVALKSDGTAVAWGDNSYGQRNVPASLNAGSAIEAGDYHNLVLRRNDAILPDGMTLSSAGVLSGTPTVAEIKTLTFTAKDLVGTQVFRTIDLTIASDSNARPALTSSDPATGAFSMDEGASQSFTVEAQDPEGQSLSYRWTWDGATVGGNSNAYAHTAAWGTNGNHTLRCYASDDFWQNALLAEWNVTVVNVPLEITTASLPSGKEMVAYSLALEAAHGAAPYTWTSSLLPEGLTLSGAGVLSGTPAVAETKTVTFAVKDQLGEQVTRSLELIIAPNPNTRPVLTSSDPSAGAFSMNEGTSQTFTVNAHDPEGKPLVYAWTWDGAPVGENSNAYAHTAAWGSIGNHTLRCHASDDFWQSVLMAEWNVKIVNVPMEITTSALPSGMELVAYSASLQAAHGAPPYAWTSAALPEGLTLSSAGVLSGLPVGADTYSVPFTARDQLGEQVSRSLEITIAPNPNTRPVLAASAPTAGAFSMNEGASQTFTVNAHDPQGQPLAYAWTWDGVPVGGNSDAYDHTAAWGSNGNHVLRCYASDDLWQNILIAQWDVTIVNVPVEITTASLPPGMEMVAYSASLQAAHGVPPYTWSVMPLCVAWGNNGDGQLTTPSDLADVIGVSAGGLHSLALQANGTVVAWGSNSSGQCTVPTGLSGVIAIAAGTQHSLALKADGTVVAWGSNIYGQCNMPTGLSDVTAIAAGSNHSLALKADGTVVAWGSNIYGQCNMPTGLSGVVAISGGFNHSLALKDDGTVVAWGSNAYDQCAVPTGLNGVIAVATGAQRSIALKNDGTVIVWGYNENGKYTVPTGLNGVTAIAAGTQHNMALKNDGTVIAWGDNFFGQINVPTGLNAGCAIAAGWKHSLVLRQNGAVLPEGLTLSSAGVLSGSPTVAGTMMVTFTAKDQLGEEVFRSVELTITPNPNTRPVFTSSAPTAGAFSMNEGASQTFTVDAHDPEGQPLSYTWTWDGTPVGGDSNVYNHIAAWGSEGEHILRCYASDDLWQNILIAQWNVTIVNRPMEITTASLPLAMEMVAYSLALEAAHGAAPYAWTSSLLPEGLTLSGAGVLSGTPSVAETKTVTFTARDQLGEEVSRTLELTVAPNPNTRPALTSSDPTTGAFAMNEGADQTFAIEAHDPEGKALTYAWTWDGAPVGGNSNAYAHTAVWGTEGGHVLRCYASDDLWQNILIAQWNVTIANSPVEIATTSLPSGMELADYSFSLQAGNGVQPYTWSVLPQCIAWGYNNSGQINIPAGLTHVIGLAAGNSHSLALKADGTVVAWGSNFYGQCTVPSGLNGVTAISAGYLHSLALKADGTVVAWGSNSNGQCTVPTGLSRVIAISAGEWHSLALREDGTAVAWGSNTYAQCTVPTGLSGVTAIAAGNSHSLALKNDGTVVAWGSNDLGQCNVPTGLGGVIAIDSGDYHSLALKSDGTVVAWGSNSYAQRTVPTGLGGVTAIAGGYGHSLALKNDGTVVAWGDNTYGQLNVPPALNAGYAIAVGRYHNLVLRRSDAVLPAEIVMSSSGVLSGTPTLAETRTVTFTVMDQLGEQVTQSLELTIAPNPNTRPALTSSSPTAGAFSMNEGTSQTFTLEAHDPEGKPLTYAWTWDGAPVGANANVYTHMAAWGTEGEHILRCYASDDLWQNMLIAQWDVTIVNLPVGITTSALSPGMEMVHYSVPFQAENGAQPYSWSALPLCMAWGKNTYGQINMPAGLASVIGLAAGGEHSLALKVDGTIIAWGFNAYGQSTVPTGLSGVTAISAGYLHSLALKGDGTVIAWGSNLDGQCAVPIGLSEVIAISAGERHNLALKADGTVIAWGSDTYSQSTVPTGLSDVIAIAAGNNHSLALKNDGTVVAWGYNGDGRSSVPPGLNNVTAVAGGGRHSLALKADGTVVAWGNNTYNECTVPTGLSGVVAIAAGVQHSLALKANGTVVAWGDNSYGQLDVPAILNAGSAIATGYRHNLVLRRSDAALPHGVSLSADGVLSGTPTLAGTHTITFIVMDQLGEQVTQSLELNIAPHPNTRPVLTSSTPTTGAFSMNEGAAQIFTVAAHDPESQALTYAWTLDDAPAGGDSNVCNHTAAWGTEGAHVLRCYASDDLWQNILIAQWDLTIVNVPMEIVTAALPLGMEMLGYAVSLQAENGAPPHSWSVLPPCLGWGYNVKGQINVPSGLTDVIRLAAGGEHSLALKADGTVVAWGSNASGQCNVPTGLSGVTAISAGYFHSVALKGDGTVVAWGSNSNGQCTVPTGLNGVLAISAGERHSLALKADGTVVAWGYNSYGQCTVPTGLSDVIAIAAGKNHSLALKADGTVVAWGINYNGQCTVPTGLSGVTAIAGGGGHSLALKADGTVVAWGNNIFSECNVPTGLNGVVAIAAGERHSLALKSDGTVVTWGDNSYSQLRVPSALKVGSAIAAGRYHNLVFQQNVMNLPEGFTLSDAGVLSGTPTVAETRTIIFTATDQLGEQASRSLEMTIVPNPNTRPVLTSSVPPAGPFNANEGTIQTFTVEAHDPEGKALTYIWTWDNTSVGGNSKVYRHATAWNNEGEHVLRCYASDDLWQKVALAQWSVTIVNVPIEITTTALPSGMEAESYNISLNAVNGVQPYTSWSFLPQYVAWGHNQSGQLNVPSGLAEVIKMATGGEHSLALKADGTVTAWGSNSYSQCAVPAGLSSVTAIAAGYLHSVALKGDGTVVAWGNNPNGECNVPSDLSGVIAISAGERHNLALKADGTVVAWGYNNYSQCSVPTGLSSVVAIAAGSNHSLALKADGTVVAWGNNSYGQCTVPTGLTGVIAIAGGGRHSLALKSDGTVVAWGNNTYGERNVPTGLSGVTAIAAGVQHCLALKNDGTVVAWGDNSYGQCNVPTAMNAVNAIATGYHHNLVLRRDDTILPEGLTLASDGVLSGQPTQAGTFTIVFLVIDQLGAQAVQSLELVIAPNPNARPILASSTPTTGAFIMNENSSQTFSVESHDPEGNPLTYNWTWDGVPVGGDSNVYNHTAAWGTDGEHILRCYVSDDIWQDVLIAQWAVTVVNVPIEITTTSLPPGMETVAYSTSFQAINGTLPYSWSVLPQGMAWGLNMYGQLNIPPGLTDAIGLATGSSYGLALKADGTVVAWGENNYGQRTVPTGLSGVVAIAAGAYHGLALKTDGTVTAWGFNFYGQCNVPAGLSGVVALAGGDHHSLALKIDGTVTAWGDNSNGQCTVPTGLSGAVVAISAGSNHSLALKNDGTVVAWGWNSYGQCTVPTGLSDVIAISGGDHHSLALKADGTVVAWGQTNYGQCTVPTGLNGVRAIAAGYKHSLALKADGTVVAWGDNSGGQCKVPIGLNAGIAIAAGFYHSFVLRRADATLPEGLTLSSDGILSGNPTVEGTRTVTFAVMDQLGAQAARSLELTIAPNPNTRPVLTASVPTAGPFSMNENSSQTFTVSAHDPEGKTLSYAWTWDGDPVGGNSNVYNHTAGWGTEGEHVLRCYASDDLWQKVAFLQWRVNVIDVPIEITTASLPSAMEMVPYQATLEAIHGLPPYSWSQGQRVVRWGTQAAELTDLNGAIAIAAGNGHALAVMANGTVFAWGSNSSGQCRVPTGLTGVIQVGAGQAHSVALKRNGTVVAWGDNVVQQCDVPGNLTHVTAISAGLNHTLALKDDGTVVGWGRNVDGPCTIPEGLSNVIAINAGGAHSMALKADGTVVAWGWNGYGHCDVPPGLNNVIAIAAGTFHSMALKADGTVVAWGSNNNGQCETADLTDMIAITATTSGEHCVGLKADGTVVAWGANNSKQCNVPTGLKNVTAIAAGPGFSLALYKETPQWPEGLSLSSEGVLSGSPMQAGTYTFSVMARDQNGEGAVKELAMTVAPHANLKPVITAPTPPLGAYSMDEGTSQTFSLQASDPEGKPLTYAWTWDGVPVDGNVNSYEHQAAWGTLGGHQLRCYVSDDLWVNVLFAQWDVTVENVPMEIVTESLPAGTETTAYSYSLAASKGGLPYRWWVQAPRLAWGVNYHRQCDMPAGAIDMIALAGGHTHSLALMAEGTVLAWGENNCGQCNVPTDLSGVTAISAGQFYSLALKADGTVVAWGYDNHGQSTVPPGLSGVTAISAGTNHNLALKNNGTVVAWGNNIYGQCNVAGLRNVVAVAAGDSHSLVLKSDGTVVAWGYNDDGRSTVPAGLSGVIAIAAGGSHSLALKDDGTVVAWGTNGFGQCSVPPGLSGVIAIAAGGNHSLALKANGTVVAWGDNYYGQCTLPTGLTKVIALAAGYNHSMVLRDPNAELPVGLTLSSDGVLSGTPTQAGTHTVTFLVQDPAGDVTFKEFVIDVLPNTLDEDKDGLPDEWEDAYDLRTFAPTAHGADDDADGDGASNDNERRAGTDPTDAQSVFCMEPLPPTPPGQGISVVFSSVPGRSYRVLCTDDLQSEWIDASGVLVATDYQTVWMAPADPVPRCLYFKVMVLAP